ncbi:MAG: ribosome maturation factor RimP [Alphaproteobacteria bacterium]|nr:ribosome maturation factor RimP [Alphaproteobacteria bacterium]
MSKAVEKKIAGLISGDLEASGYDLVRVQITGDAKYATLQIMAERKDGKGMTVDDCASISEKVSPLIEADPELTERYGLEVSSPGIDRPLVKLKDFERFKGYLAKVEVKIPVSGQRRFQGQIGKISGEEIELIADKSVVNISFENIDRAKLVLTDELLKAAASGQEG